MTAPHTSDSRSPWGAHRQVLPLLELEGELGERVRGLGAKQVNLYRSLAHTPELLQAWIDWAWALRENCATPRSLREIMILRTAVVMRSEYEWHQHVTMAERAGVPKNKVHAVTAWQSSDLFDAQERAALMLTDAMLTGSVPDAVHDELAQPCLRAVPDRCRAAHLGAAGAGHRARARRRPQPDASVSETLRPCRGDVGEGRRRPLASSRHCDRAS